MHDPEYTIDAGEDDPYYNSRQVVCTYTSAVVSAVVDAPDIPPFLLHSTSTRTGIHDAAKRHDALARRRYVKPFKWFKFNRARKATAK